MSLSLPNLEFVESAPEPRSGVSLVSGVVASSWGAELPVDAEEVLEEYAELKRVAARLRALCVALRARTASTPAGAEVLIEEFEDLVIPQFAAEKAEEFLGSLVTEEPRLLQRVERLQAEHSEMVEALERIAEFARACPPGPELAARLTRVLDAFDTHEQAENELMQEFLVLDECGGG